MGNKARRELLLRVEKKGRHSFVYSPDVGAMVAGLMFTMSGISQNSDAPAELRKLCSDFVTGVERIFEGVGEQVKMPPAFWPRSES